MPPTVPFRIGVRFDTIHAQLPVALQSKAGSWPQRVRSTGIRTEQCYCSHKHDVQRAISHSKPHPLKVLWVPRQVAINTFPAMKEDIVAATASILQEDADQEDLHEAREDTTAEAEQPITDDESGTPCDDPSHMDELLPIEVLDEERFVSHAGEPMSIRLYGERTRRGMHMNLKDLHRAFGRTRKVATDINGRQIKTKGTGEIVRVIDMWDFVALVAMWQRTDNPNAKIIYEWILDVVFDAQYGDGEKCVPQAAHAIGTGSTLPSEFGQRVCGVYAFAFLCGSKELLEEFASLRAKAIELGLGESGWYLVKVGHTENMRERIAQLRRLLQQIYPSFFIEHGQFWHTPDKKSASSAEKKIQNDPLGEYSVTLDGYDFTELFMIPATMLGEPLRVLGQDLVNDTVTRTVDTSETKLLKLRHTHRDELDALKADHLEALEGLRNTTSDRLEGLRVENARLVATDVTMRALRLMCPPRTLAKIDSLMA